MQTYLHGWVIAADIEARLKYTKQLYVWGKDRVHMSDKMSTLLTEFEDGVRVNFLMYQLCYWELT